MRFLNEGVALYLCLSVLMSVCMHIGTYLYVARMHAPLYAYANYVYVHRMLHIEYCLLHIFRNGDRGRERERDRERERVCVTECIVHIHSIYIYIYIFIHVFIYIYIHCVYGVYKLYSSYIVYCIVYSIVIHYCICMRMCMSIYVNMHISIIQMHLVGFEFGSSKKAVMR